MAVTTLEHADTQVNGFSQADKTRFLTLYEQTKNPFTACQVAGIHPSTFYRHLERDPNFAEQVRLVKLAIAYSIVPRQYERAMDKSDTAAIWLQKVFGGPEFNPDRPQLHINAQGPLQIVFPDGPPPSPPDS